MNIIRRGFTAAVLLAAVTAAPAAAAPTVSIRIEGEFRTLLERTTVELVPGQIEGVDDECDGTSLAGAIDRGTNGDWDHRSFVQTIRGERHAFENNDAWSGWLLNTGKLTGGFCQTTLQEGDDVLVQANYADPNDFHWLYQPLVLRDVPAAAEPGVTFGVRVEKIVPGRDENGFEQPDTGTFQPAGGVSVRAGDVSGATDGTGRAELVLDQPGDYLVQAASGAGLDRSLRVPVRVLAPGEPPPPAPEAVPGQPCFTNGFDGRCGTFDREAPTAFITSIAEGRRFRRGTGPRELSGNTTADGTGILMVKLRLTRRIGPRCSTWSPSRERFVPRECGAANGFWFKVGDEPDWEYLLPAGLRRGRYVLDADAIDRNGNRLRVRRRGENRVVFRVG
jgi:hypothetical protein